MNVDRAVLVIAGLDMMQAAFNGWCPAAMLFKALGVRPGRAF